MMDFIYRDDIMVGGYYIDQKNLVFCVTKVGAMSTDNCYSVTLYAYRNSSWECVIDDNVWDNKYPIMYGKKAGVDDVKNIPSCPFLGGTQSLSRLVWRKDGKVEYLTLTDAMQPGDREARV